MGACRKARKDFLKKPSSKRSRREEEEESTQASIQRSKAATLGQMGGRDSRSSERRPSMAWDLQHCPRGCNGLRPCCKENPRPQGQTQLPTHQTHSHQISSKLGYPKSKQPYSTKCKLSLSRTVLSQGRTQPTIISKLLGNGY